MTRRTIADRIDSLLNHLKWPTALAAVLLLLPALQQCGDLARRLASEPRPLTLFWGGALIWLALWISFIRSWRMTLLSTLEHELTHALFAVLTLHRVTGLRATWSHGGRMSFTGEGNWLITLAPYFFPTACAALIIPQLCLPWMRQPWMVVLTGVAFAWHLTSTLRETHPGQTDLRMVGFLFSLLVLPTANLICLGVVVAWASGGATGTVQFLAGIAHGLSMLVRSLLP